MTDDTPAATRRRWVTLAELVAVAGVVIAALTLWSGWSDRRDARAAEAAAAGKEAQEEARLVVTGEVRDGGRSILLGDARHEIQQVRFDFPASLGVPAQTPAGDPALDAGWIDDAMLKLTDGGADERSGRLPVLATVSYWDGDRPRRAALTFDVVWRTQGRMLQGRSFRLDGLKLRRTGGSAAALDRLWRKP